MSNQSTKDSYKRYYLRNKAKRNASSRAYQKIHKKKCTARKRARYAERILEDPSFRSKQSLRHKLYFRSYRPSNLGKVNKWAATWRNKNRIKLKDYSARRKARKLQGTVDLDGCEQFFNWVRNQDYVSCTYCGVFVTGKSIEIDHIVPLSRCGNHCPDNFCLSCRTCNRSKGDLLLNEWPKCPEKFRFLTV